MPRLNPYVAWMFQQFGTLDAASVKVVGNLERISKLVTEAAYLGGVSLADQLRKIVPSLPIPSDLSDSASAVLTDGIIGAVENALRVSVESEKARFLAEALRFEIHGTVFDDACSQQAHTDAMQPVIPERLPAISVALHDLCQRRTGVRMVGQAFTPFDGFAQSEARGIVRSVLSDEPRQPQELPILCHTVLWQSSPAPATSGFDPTLATDGIPTLSRPTSAPTQPPTSDSPSGETAAAPAPESADRSVVVQFGSFKRRLAAFVLDYAIVYLLAFTAYAVGGLVQRPIPESGGTSALLFASLFAVYMIAAQWWQHTTIGKYATGLQLIADAREGRHPELHRILVRETLGRAFSLLFWGAGYWTCVGDSRKQAWSDRMAGTLVVRRPTNVVLRRAFVAFLTTVVLLDIGASAYAYRHLEMQKRHAAWAQTVAKLGSDIEASRKSIEHLLGRDVADFDSYKSDMRELLPYLDAYDRDVARIRQVLRTALEEGLANDAERQRLGRLSKLWELRQQQSAKRRQQANAVLEFYPGINSWPKLKTRLELLDSDIEGLDSEANRLVQELGLR